MNFGTGQCWIPFQQMAILSRHPPHSAARYI